MTGNNGTGDERLRALFHDAVSDVEPRDRLGEVRRRTRVRRTPSRRWAPVLAGAGAVAATVVVATLVVDGVNDDPGRNDDPPVAGTSQNGVTTDAAGLYFVSDTATGPRLFREFQAVTPTDDPEQKVLIALQRLTLDSGPRDPDYRTLWPAQSFRAVRIEEDRIVVELGSADALEGAAGPAAGRFGVQQAVYTAEAALGDALPVSFEWAERPARRVLGLSVGTVIVRDRDYAITAPVNITDPSEGLLVEDGTFRANGTMSTNVRRVEWTLSLDGDVLRQGRAVPAEIDGPDARATLNAPGWETAEIDVSDISPGDYVFEVTALDVGQTSDAPREFSDTRTITVR